MPKPKVFFALPVYSGFQGRAFTSLLTCFPFVDAIVQVMAECSEVAKVRSELTAQFLRSSAEWVFFLDSDVGFEPDTILKLLACDAPLVTAVYRQREPPHHWACELEGQTLEEAPITTHAPGIRTIPISRAGLGCTLIHRNVPLAIQTMNRDLFYTSDLTGEEVCHMYAPFIEKDACGVKRLRSEDTVFYRRAMAQGIEPRCLLDATLNHNGIAANLGKYLDSRRTQG